MRTEITPRFPAGLTVIDAQGQWLNASGMLIREPTKVVILIYPEAPERDRAIRDIITHYKHQFNQENVCLNQVRSLTLDVRTWQCEKCQTNHDRDINAAKNIRDEGLRILSSGTGEIAYRPGVSRDSRGRKKSTISQSAG